MLIIATRGSLLASWQARHVEAALHTQHEGLHTSLEIVRTTGDRITDVPLSQIGDRGLFTRELDDAVLEGRAHCAVHSLKDVPTLLPDGLAIAAILSRADPRDAWLARDGSSTISKLQRGARVGTSSLRRRALLLEQRKDLEVADVRGNLDTRLEKLVTGEYDAMILAAAGLHRLDRQDVITAYLDAPPWLPAPGQGAIVVLTRDDDHANRALLAGLDDLATARAVTAERALLRALEGGCQVPIGALARVDGTRLSLDAVVASTDGGTVLRMSRTGDADAAEMIGRELAHALLDAGADRILSTLRAAAPRDTPPVTPP